MNNPTTIHKQVAFKPTGVSRPRATFIATCMTASILAGCGALFDDTGPGSSSTDTVAAKSPDPSRYPVQPNGGGESLVSTSNTPAEAESSPSPVASAPAPTPAPSAGAPPAGDSANAPPAPDTTPAPTPVAGTISNSIDTIVNDMKLMNDMKLAGVPTNYGWANGPGHVLMGNDPRGTNTPSWWQVNNSQFKSGQYWNAILPWFVVFDGVGNAASNTRVQLRNLKIYIKSKSSNRWNLIRTSTGVSGEIFTKTLQGTNVASPDTRTETDGSTSVLPPNGNLVYHGWGSIDSITGSDVAGLYITMQARLVKDRSSGPDDRPGAKYLVHVGADYYPETSTRISDLAPAYYFPGAGVSRAKLVGNDWQSYSFATIDVGVEDPGGGVMTEAQFRAVPPPL